jgi:ABC-type multidrug transport system ATPase subunit
MFFRVQDDEHTSGNQVVPNVTCKRDLTLTVGVSGCRITGVSGNVILNGEERNMDAFRRLSCYITQDDRLQSLLTVTENMRVAADLKLGQSVSRQEKNDIVRISTYSFVWV